MNIAKLGKALTGAFRFGKSITKAGTSGFKKAKGQKFGARLKLAVTGSKRAAIGGAMKRGVTSHLQANKRAYQIGGAAAAGTGAVGFAAGSRHRKRRMMRGIR